MIKSQVEFFFLERGTRDKRGRAMEVKVGSSASRQETRPHARNSLEISVRKEPERGAFAFRPLLCLFDSVQQEYFPLFYSEAILKFISFIVVRRSWSTFTAQDWNVSYFISSLRTWEFIHLLKFLPWHYKEHGTSTWIKSWMELMPG